MLVENDAFEDECDWLRKLVQDNKQCLSLNSFEELREHNILSTIEYQPPPSNVSLNSFSAFKERNISPVQSTTIESRTYPLNATAFEELNTECRKIIISHQMPSRKAQQRRPCDARTIKNLAISIDNILVNSCRAPDLVDQEEC